MQTILRCESGETYLCREFTPVKVDSKPALTEFTVLTRISDEATFERVFRQFHVPLCRYAFTIVRDAVLAEEVVQDVFLKIWEKRETIEFSVSVKSYLYRAVHNGCLNVHEKMKKEVSMDNPQLKVVHPHAAPVTDMQSRELEKEIHAALEYLPEQCRRVFELSRFGNLKYKEIAETLGISVKTVENQMGKALRIMRDRLAPYLTVAFLFFIQLANHIPVS